MEKLKKRANYLMIVSKEQYISEKYTSEINIDPSSLGQQNFLTIKCIVSF